MNSNVENLLPHIVHLMYKEMTILKADPRDGIKIFPSEEDITYQQVTMKGPEQTPYDESLLYETPIGQGLPASPLKGYFLTKISHPNGVSMVMSVPECSRGPSQPCLTSVSYC
ncbi:ubiquitin-conjugating enzyme E2 S [Sigmodon hispidus]